MKPNLKTRTFNAIVYANAVAEHNKIVAENAKEMNDRELLEAIYIKLYQL